MTVTKKDDNGFPTMFGISCVDGVTPVRIKFNSSNGGMLLDTATVISFVPDPSQALIHDDNDFPVMKGVSSTNHSVILPWYVNPTNGAVLADIA